MKISVILQCFTIRWIVWLPFPIKIRKVSCGNKLDIPWIILGIKKGTEMNFTFSPSKIGFDLSPLLKDECGFPTCWVQNFLFPPSSLAQNLDCAMFNLKGPPFRATGLAGSTSRPFLQRISLEGHYRPVGMIFLPQRFFFLFHFFLFFLLITLLLC